MKITAIRGIMLRCTCSPISDALSTSTARQALLVKIETDAGLYGIGEAFTYGARLKIMKYLVEEQLGPMLIGQDPAEIEKHWNTMYWRTIAHGRRSMTMGAISGIDNRTVGPAWKSSPYAGMANCWGSILTGYRPTRAAVSMLREKTCTSWRMNWSITKPRATAT